MFKVSIKNTNNVETNAAQFSSISEGAAWIEENHDFFPEGYTYETIDITEIKRKEKALEAARASIAFGAEIISQINMLNGERYAAGLLTDAQFGAMMNDPALFKIERLLWNGSMKTALMLIELQDETYFSSNDKLMIINKIENFLSSL